MQLEHIERVQDDKIQKQDWNQSLEKKFCAPPAPRGSQQNTADESSTKSAFPKVEVLHIVIASLQPSVGKNLNGPTHFSGVATGLFVSSTGSMECALWT